MAGVGGGIVGGVFSLVSYQQVENKRVIDCDLVEWGTAGWI